MQHLVRIAIATALCQLSCSAPESLQRGELGIYPGPPNATPAVSGMQAPATGNLGGARSVMGAAAPDGTVAMAPLTPTIINETGADNPAGLARDEVTKLMAGGPLAQLKIVYPYAGTVFPSGTVAPLVMWTGNSAPDALYLHIKSQSFEYKGVLAPGIGDALFVPNSATSVFGPGLNSTAGTPEPNNQLAIPQHVWDAAAQHTQGKTDPLRIEISERVAGQIYGPATVQITIARGAVQGSIYYNSCFSASPGSSGSTASALGNMSKIMRIPPGGHAEVISSSVECVGCHSVSANGSRLIAQRAEGIDDFDSRLAGQSVVTAWSAPLDERGKLEADMATRWGTMGAFGALYPDGSKYLAPSGDAALSYANRVMPLSAAVLLDAVSGVVVPGTGIPESISMPNFSPDGTRLVFNDTQLGKSHGLAWMSYDTHTHQARDYQMLVQDDPALDVRPGWPFFLPDNQAVVFVQTSTPDFTSYSGDAPTASLVMSPAMYPSDLYVVDVATGKQTMLAKAMGFATPDDASADATFLDYGKEQLHRNFFPTVSPVASGGYFWVFFSSLRHFGSMGPMHALWGAAIDIHPDGSYTSDPSHPAFYVPGQELINISHHRAFAALDACRPDGDVCQTGIDCCSGRCTSSNCSAAPPPTQKSCAKVNERCVAAADCCDADNYCINNFCAFVELL